MNQTIKLPSVITAIAVSLALLGGGAIAQADEKPESAEAKTYAVLFYADWCGTCKALDPKIEEAREALAEEPVLYVTFDMTDEKTTRHTAMLANALQLDEHFNENAGRTGFLLLIDAESREVVDRITREDSAEDIRNKIAAATS